MEASALTHAGRRGLLPRRSPLLRLQKDEQLVTLIRSGHDHAFEVLFDRYNSRLLAFCRSMLKSQQDAEDVLQEVFVAAHKAMLGDERRINVRPWIYRIARNRCLNYLRKPVAEGQDTMDYHPHEHGATTDDCVQQREELRQVISDVKTLPETQQTALLLREIDALSYEEIAQAMDTTIPGVKSLLVRARIRLAESSEARLLTCDDVRLELAEAAEGLRKASGPVRQHVRGCDGCSDFRSQLRSDRKALAAIFPLGPIALFQAGILAKLGIGGGAGSSAASGAGSGALGSGAIGSGAIGGGAAAGGTAGLSGMGALGAIGGAIGGKTAVGVATAALLTAGAVEVGDNRGGPPTPGPAAIVAPIVRTTPADIEIRHGENSKASKQKAEKSEADVGDEGALAAAETDTPLAAAETDTPLVADEAIGELTGGTAAGDIPEEEVKAGESSGDDHNGPMAVLGTPPIIIVGTGEGESGESSGVGNAGSGGGDPPEIPIEEDPDQGEPADDEPGQGDDSGEPELPTAAAPSQAPMSPPATAGVVVEPAPASAAPVVRV